MRAIPADRTLDRDEYRILRDDHEADFGAERERRPVRALDRGPHRYAPSVCLSEDLTRDLRTDSAAAVLRQERQVDQAALVRRPGDPGAADRASVEQDQLVRRAGEARLPLQPLRPELQIEERLAWSVLPPGDIGPRRDEEVAEERLICCGDSTPLERAVQFREGKMPCRAMM